MKLNVHNSLFRSVRTDHKYWKTDLFFNILHMTIGSNKGLPGIEITTMDTHGSFPITYLWSRDNVSLYCRGNVKTKNWDVGNFDLEMKT